ncbi:MAG: ATP/GTP-binding protein, partial [Nocardioides sp.]
MTPRDAAPAEARVERRTVKNHSPKGGMRGVRAAGGGYSRVVQPADEFRGTTVQVCGLWPFAAGTGAPSVGVPIGRHAHTSTTVCCDPISWFQRAILISNPSAFVLGKPGLGKSTLVRRWCTGLAGYGVLPLVLGDLRPDYVNLIRALGGQVIQLGQGRGSLNVLDPGEARVAAARLPASARARVLNDAATRRLTIVSALITIARHGQPTDHEMTIVDRALRLLDDRLEGVPSLPDLLAILQEAPDELRAVALDRGDRERYQDRTESLEAS